MYTCILDHITLLLKPVNNVFFKENLLTAEMLNINHLKHQVKMFLQSYTPSR